MSFADAVERRQADIVRLDGEEGDEEEESELEAEEVVDKQQGERQGWGGPPAQSAQTASTLAAQGLEYLEYGPPMTA